MLSYMLFGVLAFSFGLVLAYQSTLQQAGVAVSMQHNIGLQPIAYQNAFTPPYLTILFLVLSFSLLALATWQFISNGLWTGMAFLFAAILLPLLISMILRGLSRTFLAHAHHTMVHRMANYARDGDSLRSAAMAEHIELLQKVYPWLERRVTL